MHKFYVSLTEIRIFPEKSSIQISMRVFPDDLDHVLEKIHGTNPQLATDKENRNADQWVDKYIREHFMVRINDEALFYTYLGKEQEADAVWIFLEIAYTGVPESIFIENSFLTDYYDDQKNIVQVYYRDFNKSLLLSGQVPSGKLHITDQPQEIK